MAARTTSFLTLMGVLGSIGCESVLPERPRPITPVAQVAGASWRVPGPSAELVSPAVHELAGPQSVDTYVQLALSRSPKLAAARSRVEAAEARVPQAASLKDPTLDVLAWPFYPHTPQTASGRMTVDMMVSQEMPWFGKRATRAAAACEAVNAAHASLAATELQTIEAVKLAYFDLYFVQKSIRITQQDRQFLANIVEIAEAKYRTGKSSQQDVLRLQAELANVDAELIRLRKMQASAQAELASELYVSPETQLATLAELPAEELPRDLERLYEHAIASRPELHAMLAEIERDRRMVDLARLEYCPDFTFKFGWGEMTTDRALAPTADGIDNLTTGVSVNLPIYRGRLDAAVREAESQLVASARQYDSMKIETQREIKRLFTEAISQRDLAQLFQNSIIPKTEQALQISTQAYQVGEVSFADLLDTWRELLRFHIAHLQQETQLRKSLASLERIVGGELATKTAVPSGDAPAEQQ